MKVEDLKMDSRNYRKHNTKNKQLIKKSINDVGFGRSIVIDANDEIICGNGVVSQIAKSTPIKVVESNGSELIVVKRTDLQTDDIRRKQLAIMDNSASDSSEFDLALLNLDFEMETLQDYGIFDAPKVEDEEVEVEKPEIIDPNINTEYERIIITYKPEDKEKLEQLLHIQNINQIIYEFSNGELK